MTEARPRIYYGWIIVISCLVISFITFGVHYSYGVFFESIENYFGWSRAQTSGVFSAYVLIFGVLAFLAGVATDRLGPRKVVTFGGFFGGLGLVLTSQATQPWQMYISYSIMFAIGTATSFPPLMATTSRWFTTGKQGLPLGIVACGLGLGTVVFAPLSTRLIQSYGWSTAYLILGLAQWIIILPVAQLLRKEPITLSAPAPAVQAKPASSPVSMTLKQALATRNLWLVYVMYFLWMVCEYIVLAHLVRHALDLQVDATIAATFVGTLGAVSVAARVSFGPLSDKIGRRLTLALCGMLLGLPVLSLLFINSIWAFYIFSAFFGLGFGGKVAVVPALLREIFGTKHIGTIYGSVMILIGIGMAVGPLLAGYIYDVTQSYNPAFLIGGLASLVAALAAYFVRMPRTGLLPGLNGKVQVKGAQ